MAGAEGKGGADAFFSEMRGADNGTSETELVKLFEAGKNASRRGGVDEVIQQEAFAVIGCVLLSCLPASPSLFR